MPIDAGRRWQSQICIAARQTIKIRATYQQRFPTFWRETPRKLLRLIQNGDDNVPYSGEYDGSVTTVLEDLRRTADLEGLAILDLSQIDPEPRVSYCIGLSDADAIGVGYALLARNPKGPAHAMTSDRRPIMACPWVQPSANPGGLVLWRAPRSRRWTEADYSLVASLTMLLEVAVGSGAGQIGIDRLTGLPNRRWFLDEADRHIDRLELDAETGTLLLIDIDGLRRLNSELGRDEGDRVLAQLGSQLHATVRPGDILARIGGDEFAAWFDGMDHLTAAERADALCNARLFRDLPEGHKVTFSIGIATRHSGSAEDIRTLLRRAYLAMREVKSGGGGSWRVAHTVPAHRGTGSVE